MDIITVLKANIKKKKGSFASIVFLTFIIVMIGSMIVSVRDNYTVAMEKAFDDVDGGDVLAIVNQQVVEEHKLLEKVENSSLVDRVTHIETIATINSNTKFMQKMRPGIKLFTKDKKSFEKDIPKLKPGEIYVSLGMKEQLGINLGDVVTYETLAGEYKFTVKGYVQEPYNGSSTIGWKQVFISDEEYEEIKLACDKNENEEKNADFLLVNIFKADKSISDIEFQKKINLETKIIDNGTGALTKQQSKNYTLIFFDIASYGLLAFGIFLWVIVIIVIANNISNEIENDYVNIGILKALGFTKEKLIVVMAMQYTLAQVVGIVVGLVFTKPLVVWVGGLFRESTSILAGSDLSFGKILILVVSMMLMSTLVILIKTKKVAAIYPVRAISKGRAEVYFDNRLNVPISKKAFAFTMGLRNITSGVRRYLGTICIVSMLVLFMLTVNLLGDVLNSRNALNAMGMQVTDLDISYKKKPEKDIIGDIERIIEKHTKIEKKYYTINLYMSINGENLFGVVHMHPEYIGGILEGRAPLYDNEIIITPMVAELLDVKMGDEVIVSNDNESETYIISGIYQSVNDAGMTFAISKSAAAKIGAGKTSCLGMELEDPSKTEIIAKELNEELGEYIEATAWGFEEGMDALGYGEVLDAVKLVIYIVSVIFMLVVVGMVCAKAFARERTDIGIQKALGVTTRNLRLQFAARFLVISIIGALIGVALSGMFSADMLNAILKNVGIYNIVTEITLLSILIPVIITGVSFFFFAYIASRKVKKVAIRELVAET